MEEKTVTKKDVAINPGHETPMRKIQNLPHGF